MKQVWRGLMLASEGSMDDLRKVRVRQGSLGQTRSNRV
jgi:hypothetical protein